MSHHDSARYIPVHRDLSRYYLCRESRLTHSFWLSIEYSADRHDEHGDIPTVSISADGAKEHALRREPLKPGEERGPRLMHPKDVRYEKAEQDAKHICDEQKTRER